jgi:hypothetical protein
MIGRCSGVIVPSSIVKRSIYIIVVYEFSFKLGHILDISIHESPTCDLFCSNTTQNTLSTIGTVDYERLILIMLFNVCGVVKDEWIHRVNWASSSDFGLWTSLLLFFAHWKGLGHKIGERTFRLFPYYRILHS